MNSTLAIIKPDGVAKGVVGAIIDKIQSVEFRILTMKYYRFTEITAKEFYRVHRDRPFYQELVEFMISGPCVPIALEKSNAVLDFRKLIGDTDPLEAAEGTIRKLYASNKGKNVIHGSDSDKNANIEISFFFSREEIISLHV